MTDRPPRRQSQGGLALCYRSQRAVSGGGARSLEGHTVEGDKPPNNASKKQYPECTDQGAKHNHSQAPCHRPVSRRLNELRQENQSDSSEEQNPITHPSALLLPEALNHCLGGVPIRDNRVFRLDVKKSLYGAHHVAAGILVDILAKPELFLERLDLVPAHAVDGALAGFTLCLFNGLGDLHGEVGLSVTAIFNKDSPLVGVGAGGAIYWVVSASHLRALLLPLRPDTMQALNGFGFGLAAERRRVPETTACFTAHAAMRALVRHQGDRAGEPGHLSSPRLKRTRRNALPLVSSWAIPAFFDQPTLPAGARMQIDDIRALLPLMQTSAVRDAFLNFARGIAAVRCPVAAKNLCIQGHLSALHIQSLDFKEPQAGVLPMLRGHTFVHRAVIWAGDALGVEDRAAPTHSSGGNGFGQRRARGFGEAFHQAAPFCSGGS